ncbi:E3 SUMO-protein ligase RanBP2-like isoform X2 [Thrips palmi]|uniref:E3 SUMO-protein ligase RanBP2-like isoform X2 n=1 Tax=Thrips palmi TaxID=161013 RepID=A0A6P8YNU9_THRPL|nr:E3 SUMO-protein ligase RanBP2-like isoform X2 [Thrips palmi]
MLRSQKDVDKHVQDIFRKITNEKERNLRCYNVAKLYQKVGDHQSTKQYVELYLRDRPKVAGAHKLLGQALEGLKDYSKALEEYKCSLTLEHRQPDLVLKVCELLVETKTKINAGEAKYWIEKAEEVTDNHHAVFRLKEYLLTMDNGSGDNAQLAQLIEREIEARPLDHVPRIRLLNLYLDSKKVIDAYKYAIEIESRNLFRDNLQWYTCIVEVIKAYQRESTNLNGEFYVHLLSILERYVTLCFREQVGGHSSNVSNALFALDQACYEAFKFSEKDGNQLLLECLRHMGGQLCFHLGAAWLRIGKQSRSTGWKECTPYAWALLALAYSPPATTDVSSLNAKDKTRRHLKLWKEDAAFRCTQAGHILLSMPRDQQLERFSQCSSGNWRGKVFSMLFPVQSKNKTDAEKSSFFTTNDRFADIPEVSPSLRDIALHDEIGQHHRPDSLHALVWLGLRHLEPPSKNVSPLGMPYILPYKLSPSFACHVFEEMKLSTINLETGGVETLSRLDIDTFLYAAVFCAAAAQDERNFLGDGRLSVLPVDLTDTLCTDAQSKWWQNTYKLHSNKSRNDIGEVRMVVSRGLEVVRLLGNHGMDVRLVVLLAKVFTEKASALITPKDNIPDISKRALLFWQCAITLLERMERNHPLRVSGNPMFVYGGKDLTPSEIKMLLEEGRFFMACRLMKEDKYEEAIEAFQDLKNPYASFYEGLMYKKLADAELMSLPNENVSSEMKSKYIILLQKSLSALHLTLDRLRSPQNAGNHPLSLELEQHLQEVENCLMREDSNFVFSIVNRNPQDNVLDDSFTSNRFDDSIQNASRFVNTSMHCSLLPNVSRVNGQGLTSTPFKGKRNIDSTGNLDASHSQRLEARPSPERLDAQMRRMTITTDAVMQVVVEQNRQMLDLNKTMMDALEKTRASVEDLQKQMSDLKLEVGKLKGGDNRGLSGKTVDYSNMAARGADVYDYDVAASQFHPTRGYPSTASYGHFPGQGYSYDNCAAANNIHPIPSMLHQTLLPQAQMPLSRNMDPNLLLASYYPQAMGHNFSDRQTGIPISNTLPGQIATPGQSNVQVAGVPAAADAASVDSFRKTSLMGTPIISHTTNHPIDLCASSSISSVSQPLLPTVDISAQRFNLGSQSGLSHGSKTSTSSADTVPHNFQISMPPQATIPTTESLEKSLSPLKPISTDSILPNVPMPTYSAVSAKGSDQKVSRHSTGSASGNDTFTEDADYNPCADFKPIIPLPEEITVTTGEEDETVLFVRRAKLFRFVAGEWKERGVGDIKILKHNITGKPRILMRREQVHKICANHFILPEMELSAQKGSDRAWNWGANDFSDGEACIEKLCVRFKTVEDAEQFKTAFDDARKLAKNATPVKGASTAVSKPEGKTMTPGSQASTAPAGKVELGGFSFISPPVLKPVERQVKTSPGKDKENVAAVSKPSPFAGFSFTPSTTNAFGSATSLAGSSFVSTSTAAFGSVSSSSSTLFGQKVSPSVASSTTALTDKLMFNNSNSLLDFAAIAAQSKGSEVGKKDSNFKGFAGAGSKVFGSTVSKVSDGNVSSSNDSKSIDQDATADGDEFEPTAVFNPVIPLPSLVEVRTGEEDEEVLFAERAKLLRFDASMKEWKERGVGKMKVLKNPNTGKVRLLMRREQVLKVCCNHFITKDLQFKLMTTSDKAITWSAQDFAEGEVSVEVFALRFKSPELMHAFKDVVEGVQSNISDSATNSPASAPKPSTIKDAQPLAELFKPQAGSWECTGCYTRNGAEITSCPCCSQPKPGCEAKVAESKSATNSAFSFGIKTNSTDDAKSTSGFTFGNTATAPQSKPLSELFKPKEGSWTCAGCYTINTAEQLTCPCCSQPQPGSEAKVAESKSSQSSSFSFGVKTTSSDQPKAPSGFAFGNISTDSKDKTPLSELFKPKEGSWSCDACYTRCDADATACIACEAPKPGHENDKKSAGSTFSFGMPSAPVASFSFGVAPSGEVKSSFPFGLPTSTASDADKGFSFGAGTQPTSSSSSGFTFGASTLTPNQPSFASLASSQPSFGSPHKFEFHMKAQSPSKSPGKSPGAPSGEEDSDDDHVEENPDVGDFKPVVPLPDKVPVVTGEEEETALYCHRAKLYRFVTGEGAPEWKERGLGDIKVLRHNVTNKPRLLMRREQVLKICLNHYILPDLELTQKDEKTWMWHAQDFSEGVLAPEQFACRFKTAEIAADFAAAVEEAKKLTVLPSPGAGTTPIRAKDAVENNLQWRGKLLYCNLSCLLTQQKIALSGSHSSKTSLFFVYPFCNCIVFHCLYVELQSPLVSHAARCIFRPFVLWHSLSKFRSALTNASPRFQQILLCWICLTQSNKLFLTI